MTTHLTAFHALENGVFLAVAAVFTGGAPFLPRGWYFLSHGERIKAPALSEIIKGARDCSRKEGGGWKQALV